MNGSVLLQGIVAAGLTQYRASSADEVINILILFRRV